MRQLGKYALIVALLASPVLVHMASALKWPVPVAASCVALQMGIVLAAVLSPWDTRWKWPLVVFLAAFAIALAWTFGTRGFVVSAGLPHAAAYSSLCAMFGLSLRADREPIITSIMRRIHRPLAPEWEIHGRHVTVVWACFFGGQLAMSALLFLFAPLQVWSFFVNVLNLPLVLAMFTVEYTYRRLRYRHLTHSRVRDMLRAVAAWRVGVEPGKVPEPVNVAAREEQCQSLS